MPSLTAHSLDSSLGANELSNAKPHTTSNHFPGDTVEVYHSNSTVDTIRPDRALLKTGDRPVLSLALYQPQRRPLFINFTKLLLNRNKNKTQQTEMNNIQRKYVFIDKRRGKNSQLTKNTIVTKLTSPTTELTSLTSKITNPTTTTENVLSITTTNKTLVKVKVVKGDDEILVYDKTTTPDDLSGLDLLYTEITTIEPSIRKRHDSDLSTTLSTVKVTTEESTTTTLAPTTEMTTTLQTEVPNTGETTTTEVVTVATETTPLLRYDDTMITTATSSSTNHKEIYETALGGWTSSPDNRIYSIQYRPLERDNTEYVTMGRFSSFPQPTQPSFPGYSAVTSSYYETSSDVAPSTYETESSPADNNESTKQTLSTATNSNPETKNMLNQCYIDIGAICPRATPAERDSFVCYGSGIIACDNSQSSICRLYESRSLANEQSSQPEKATIAPFYRPMSYFFCNRQLPTSECFGTVECTAQSPANNHLIEIKSTSGLKGQQENDEIETTTTNGTVPQGEIDASGVQEQVKQESKLSRVQIGLIGALIAVGSIMFIIVSIIAFIT